MDGNHSTNRPGTIITWLQIPNPDEPTSGRTLIYDGLAQNDVDMAFHRLLNLDLSNLPPSGIPPTIVLPQNQWLHGWNAPSQTWVSSRPTFLDIGPDNGTLTSDQQSRISQVGHVRLGTWDATPLDPSKVPTLDAIRLPLANVNLNSKRITLLADPIDPQDAVNKRFMDFLLQGLNPKAGREMRVTRFRKINSAGPKPLLEYSVDGKTTAGWRQVLTF